MEQLKSGVEPSKVVFEKKLPIVQNHSVSWLVNAYEAINKHELVEKVSYPPEYFELPFLTMSI